jgi:predicted glycosyltransferase
LLGLPSCNAYVFICEPVVDPHNFRLEYGFTDLDSLQLATKIFDYNSAKTLQRWKLLIKLHPRDSIVAHLSAQYTAIDIAFAEWDKAQVFRYAKTVYGMSSTLLFECAALGIPTLSFQPCAKKEIEIIKKSESIIVLTSFDDLDILERSRQVITTNLKDFINSTERFQSLIMSILI